MIDRAEPIEALRMKQFGGIGRIALDAKKNVESGGTRGRDLGPRALGLCFHFNSQYDGSQRYGEIFVTITGRASRPVEDDSRE